MEPTWRNNIEIPDEADPRDNNVFDQDISHKGGFNWQDKNSEYARKNEQVFNQIKSKGK